MIEINQIRLITLQIQDDDIETFVSLISKLGVACKQTGFKKPFDKYERELIENISEQLGIDKIEEVRIYNEKEQVSNKE